MKTGSASEAVYRGQFNPKISPHHKTIITKISCFLPMNSTDIKNSIPDGNQRLHK